jgi:UDP-N-acetylglucosamine 1-carboxyvinyltransferase
MYYINLTTSYGNFQNRRRHSTKGEITPQGAKNEALQIYVLFLTPEKVTINNI